MEDARPPGRSLPTAASDDGLADPALATALTAWAARPGPGTRAGALSALVGARVFAAVAARSTAEHVHPATGLRAESTAEMALVTLAGSTGRGVPVFLDVPAVTGFSEGARPVRLSGAEACRAALDDGAVALVVDPQGAGLVLAGAELTELAAGRVPVAGAALSSRSTASRLTAPVVPPDGDLLRRLGAALAGEPVRAARLLDGPDGPVLGVVPQRSLDAASLAALAGRIVPQLAEPLDLAVVPPEGPGIPVPLPRRWRVLRRGP